MKRKIEIIESTLLSIALYGMMIVVPLYVRNQYFDMLEAKAHIYNNLLLFFLVLTTIEFLIQLYNNRDSLIAWLKSKLTLINIGVFLFALCSVASTFLGISFNEAWTGELGWFIGSRTILSLSYMFLVFSGVKKVHQYVFIPVLLITGLIMFEIILEGTRFDFLGYHNNILPAVYHNYYSTLGNVNWISGYLSLWVPLLLGLYIAGKRTEDSYFFHILLLLGCFATLIIAADSIYLAYGFCLFFALPYILTSKESLRRFVTTGVCFSFAMISISFLRPFRIVTRRAKGITHFLLLKPVALITFVLLVILWIIVNRTNEEMISNNRKKLIIIGEIILAAVALVFVILSIKGFDPMWGSGRASIWHLSFDVYNSLYTFKEKLIGIGPELQRYIYIPISAEWNQNLTTSHSEWIQVLISMGAIGLLTYLLAWGSVFLSYIKDKKWRYPFEAATSMSLIAYFGQSLVNSAMMTNAVTLTTFMILYALAKNNRIAYVEASGLKRNKKRKKK